MGWRVLATASLLLAVTNVPLAVAQIFCFDPPVTYGAGTTPRSVFPADLDGDYDVDLVVTNEGDDNVSIFMNNGSGGFAPRVNYAVGDAPEWVVAANLDGDSDQDLAVANRNSNNVSVLKNNGDGTFAAAVNYAAGTWPHALFAQLLDADSDTDLVVANYVSNNVSILMNDGSGSFTFDGNYSVGTSPRSVYAADLDGDSDPDLATGNIDGNNVSVLMNISNTGTYAAAVNYPTGAGALSVIIADVDADNDSDLVVANQNSDDVSVLKNNGSGSFASAVNYAAGDEPQMMCGADMDGDGDLDLAVPNFSPDIISILENDGSGSFASRESFAAGDRPVAVAAADLDGDGDIDLAVTNHDVNTLSILFNCSACTCPCHADPVCDGVTDVLDVNRVVDWIARSGPAIGTSGICPGPYGDADADCSGSFSLSDVSRFLNVAFGGADPATMFCQPTSNPCPPLDTPPVPSSAGSVIVESRTFEVGQTACSLGVFIQNAAPIYGLVLPLEIRSVNGGAYLAGDIDTTTFTIQAGRRFHASGVGGGVQVARRFDSPAAANDCSGPASLTWMTSAVSFSASSPDAVLYSAVSGGGWLAAGNDPNRRDSASFLFMFDVNEIGGTFEIDTCCRTPENHLLFVDDQNNPIRPAFTKGVITLLDFDIDDDGFPDSTDNCPVIFNPNQADGDSDGVGNLCDSLVITAYSPVDLALITSNYSDSIGIGFNTFGATAEYDTLTDYGIGPNGVIGEPDDRLLLIGPTEQLFIIRVTPETEADTTDNYFLGVRDPGGNLTGVRDPGGNVRDGYLCFTVSGAPYVSDTPVTNPVPPQGETSVFSIAVAPQRRGDLNGDGVYDILDVVETVNYAFRGKPLPELPFLADVNSDGIASDVLDVVYIVDHVFRAKQPPGP